METKSSHVPASPVLGLVVVLAVAAGCGDPSNPSTDATAVAAVQRYPETLAELETFYPAVDPAQNAALLYTEAFAKMTAPNKQSPALPLAGKGKLPPLGTRMPSAMRRESEKWIQQNAGSLLLIAQAGSLKSSRYPIDLSKGYETQMPHLSSIREASFLLGLQAMLSAEDNETARATISILQILDLAQSLRTEPTTISQLIRFRVLAVGCRALEYGVNGASFGEPELKSLQSAFREAVPNGGLKTGILGERCTSISAFAGGRKNMEALHLGITQLGGPGLSKFDTNYDFEADRKFYRQAIDEYVERLDRPFPDRLANIPERMVETTKINQYPFSSLLLPPGGWISREALVISEMRVALAALAIERHRRAHNGNVPTGLALLAPDYLDAIPMDPYSGKDLLYAIRPNGYAVYSVGSDQVDDHGLDSPNSRSKTFDVVFTSLK